MNKVGMISLGCPRNLVDSEVMLGSLKKRGFLIKDSFEDGVDIGIINTCAFLRSAREESVDTISQAIQLKGEGRIKYLVVCGCLGQLYKEKLLKGLSKIDLVLGTNDFFKIADLIKGLALNKRQAVVSDKLDYLYSENSPRFSLTPAHYAYVKIIEGCSNFCSYCIISRLRGKSRSRTIESILKEIGGLAKDSVLKEINLIGQDTTFFGMDRSKRSELAKLLREISKLKNNVRWVRILYTHPAHYTSDLIRTIREEERVCKYLDLPTQHSSDKILKAMNRGTTRKELTALIEKLRKDIPGIVLRTSIIVGFPGESDKDFKELLDFIRVTRFERLGAFLYSKEEGTKAARFKNQIPEREKQARFDEVMKLQQRISSDINSAFLGKEIEVLIDEEVAGETDRFLGRTQGDAPEVDGTVFVTGSNLKPGEFYQVKIKDTLEYDLVGEAI
ncbi:MAG: 30S ribosomal protein S12 methylthiotransferase RimO [Candidatus Omnitrophica bacterium]|nr:30S ribosomal protein S12 methylthiotransferase RimO [Candidatus Omnitrophota bacterium]